MTKGMKIMKKYELKSKYLKNKSYKNKKIYKKQIILEGKKFILKLIHVK